MAKTFSWIFGLAFLLVGILGFFGNPIVGETGFFHTDATHNWVHLVSGAIFIIVALFASAYSAMWMKIFGLIYLIVAIIGFVGMNLVLGFISVNSADNFLHLVLGIVIGLVGIMAGRKSSGSAVVM